jgi:hypothetical protein
LLGEASKPTPPALLPFAPRDVAEWSDDHFRLFEMVEVAVGHYKEVDPEESAAQSKADKIQKTMEEGGDWRSLLEGYDSNAEVQEEIPLDQLDKLFSDADAMSALKDSLDRQRDMLEESESAFR